MLRETLALAHPVIPFVTEEIWSLRWEGLLAESQASPVEDAFVDADAEASLGAAIATIKALRNWRESVQAKPKVIVRGSLTGEQDFEEIAPLIARMARFDWATQNGEAAVATVPVPSGAVAIHATEGIDLAAAERRREAERRRLEDEIERCEGKLANERFVADAPESVVAHERTKLATLRDALRTTPA